MKTIAFICLAAAVSISFSDAASWGYDGETGPEAWSTLTGGENCAGKSQSPIDLDTKVAVEQQYEPWVVTGFNGNTFDGPHPTYIINNGHTLQVNLEGDYFLSGGGLPSEYQTLQFHLHWGDVDDYSTGSEHTFDGKSFPAEVHFVHYDHLNYPFVPAAITEPQGLAVLGFFFELGEHNAAWDPIFRLAKDLQYNGDRYSYNATELFTISSLIPSDLTKFYRYNGSLTTPGCYESVVWTVFDETIKVSAQQIDQLKDLSWFGETEEFKPILNSYRPVQPLNDRTLYRGIMSDNDAGPGLPGAGSGEGSVAGSCANHCGSELDLSSPCQCNSVCREYGDCCADYEDLCLVEVCTLVPTFLNKQRKQKPENEN